MGVITVDITQDREAPKRKRDREIPTDNAVVIAIDPGETTGWSMITFDPRCLSNQKYKVLGSIYEHLHGQVDEYRGNGQYPNDGECLMVNDLVGLIDAWPYAAIVIEDFILMQKRKDRALLSPVRVTYKIEQHLWNNHRVYFKQQPSMAKTTADDDKLRRWGMYQSEGALEHARDADRHAITFLRRCVAAEKLRVQAFPHLYGEGAPYAR